MYQQTIFIDPAAWRLQEFAAKFSALARCVVAGPVRGWLRFENHLRGEGKFRLLRAGLSQEASNVELLVRNLADSLAAFRRERRLPALHLYFRDGEPVAQLAIPVCFGARAAVIVDGDGKVCYPRTVLAYADVERDRQTAVAALDLISPADPDDEAARNFLLEALWDQTKHGIG